MGHLTDDPNQRPPALEGPGGTVPLPVSGAR